MVRLGGIFVLIIMTASCGGSGDSSTPTSPSPGPTPPTTVNVTPAFIGNGFSLFHHEQNLVGQSVSLAAVATDSTRFTQVSWEQIEGPQVAILANHTQVIGFDAKEVGNYLFRFTANNDQGQSIAQTIQVDVQQSDQQIVNVRLDHAAAETSKASIRVDVADESTITAIDWTQTAGPPVENIQEQDNFLFFDTPAVDGDSVIEFETTVTFSDGRTAKDKSFVVVMDVNINSNGFFPNSSNRIVTPDTFAYKVDSPYAEALESCIYNNMVDSSCSFNQLPLIGQEFESPDVDDIMDRVLVSHSWMGERFEQYLRQSVAAPDMLQLLRATTAIVIAYDVRPSFYWSATGAIYLDANNFWVTPQERDTLNDQPDFRSDFGNELQFFIPWRYVKNNDYYFSSSDYPIDQRLTKTFADMEASITWLMYHELGHANDFFPPSKWQSISRTTSPLRYINDNEPNSTSFSTQFPLLSTELSGLAQVSFTGVAANEPQKALTPQDVALHFEPDNAAAYYSYSTIREDYAILFERFMMLHRMGVSADVAVVPSDSDNFSVVWGQRDRISESALQSRVKAVVEQVLPDLDVAEIQLALPAALSMTPGLGWRENLNLGQENSVLQSKDGNSKETQDLWMEYQHHFPSIPAIK